MASDLKPALAEKQVSCILNPRFATYRKGRHRIIGDLEVSRVIDTAACKDTYRSGTFGILRVQIKRIYEITGPSKANMYAFDPNCAYKNVSVPDESRAAATM